MVASYSTVEKVLEVVRKHVTEDQLRAIIEDLKEIPGNSSFLNTIHRLDKARRTNRKVETGR